jgi:hypothetical protein
MVPRPNPEKRVIPAAKKATKDMIGISIMWNSNQFKFKTKGLHLTKGWPYGMTSWSLK